MANIVAKMKIISPTLKPAEIADILRNQAVQLKDNPAVKSLSKSGGMIDAVKAYELANQHRIKVELASIVTLDDPEEQRPSGVDVTPEPIELSEEPKEEHGATTSVRDQLRSSSGVDVATPKEVEGETVGKRIRGRSKSFTEGMKPPSHGKSQNLGGFWTFSALSRLTL